MEYADFVLQLTPGSGGSYTARVVSSPAGEAQGSFAIPLRREELSSWTEAVTRAAERNLTPGRPETLAEPPSRELGDRLFRALFSGPLRSRLDESLGLLGTGQERGLRLRLQMSLDDPALARLQALPWELLFRAEQGAFLALSSQLVVVRSPSLPLAGQRPPASRPLRLLALVCAPRGLPHLDLSRESETLRRICGAGLAEVQFLEQPTLDDLRQALRTFRPHILHVMGHGDFDPESGRGRLFFTGDDGGPEPVDGELLADHLRDCPSLLLVFLNACQTARLSAPNPFAGLATALLQAGVPSVLAMQFPVRDDAAIAFSGEVYRQLAQGEPIETAVAEGRLALRRRLPAAMEWGTPVLFLRANDGHLFRDEERRMEEAVPPPPPPVPTGRRTGGWAWGSVLAAALLGAGIGAAGWLKIPSPAAPQSAPAVSTEPRQDPPPPLPQPTEGVGKTAAEPSLKPAPPKPRPKKLVRDRQPDAATPIQRTPRSAGVYQVSTAGPVYLPEVQAEVSAQFLRAFGENEYRLSFSPRRGSFSQTAPALAGDSYAFDTTAGKVWIDVLAIDWEHQTLTVRPRLEPG